MLLTETARREKEKGRAAALRAGLIAAAVYNVHRRKGTRPLKASDFVAEPRRRMTHGEAMAFMDGWVAQQNKSAS